MSRSPAHVEVWERRVDLASARAEAQRIVREGLLRAFPDLRLVGWPGHCDRCRHLWTLHDYVQRWPGDRRVLPCPCCDRYVRRGR